MTFDDLVKEMRTVGGPGKVTVVTYDGLKFAMDCGIDIISDYAEMYTCQAVVRDCGTPAQRQRLKEALIAGRWSADIWREHVEAGIVDPDSDVSWEDQLKAWGRRQDTD